MSTKFFLNFYGFQVAVDCHWAELTSRLKKDFWHFLVQKGETSDLEIKIEETEVVLHSEDKRFTYKSSKVFFFDEGSVRHCFYHGKAESEINFKTGRAKVFGVSIDAVHEVSYLLILSRAGKALDLRGLHRIHAGSWRKDDTLYLALFSSGKGKSTLITKLVEGSGGSLFSDDSPLVNGKGDVLPFPMRVGFSSEAAVLDCLKDKPSYELERFRFGKKRLYSLEDLNWPIGGDFKKVIMISDIARDSNKDQASFNSCFGIKHLRHLFLEGLIGFGLPILYEYFWENGFHDFLRKTKIVFMRFSALMRLWLKAKKYEVTLSSDPSNSYEMIKELMKKS